MRWKTPFWFIISSLWLFLKYQQRFAKSAFQMSSQSTFTKFKIVAKKKECYIVSWSSPSVIVSNVLITARTTTLETNQSCRNWNITDIVNFNTAFIGYMEISFFAHEIFQFASSVIPNLATLRLSKLRPFWSPWRGEKKLVTKIIAVKVAHLATCDRQ